jgi:hypothetical protein
MSIAELQAYAATQNAIAAYHRGELQVADTQSAAEADLDAKFGLSPKATIGVSYDANSGVQSFGVPVATPAPSKQAPRVTHTTTRHRCPPRRRR